MGDAKQDGGTVDWSTELAAHEPWLRTALGRRLADRHAVDEVLQEVALAATRGGDLPRERIGVARWLYRVALRQAWLHHRRHGREERRRSVAAERGRARQDVEGGDPLALLLATERHELVRAAVALLRPSHREVLLLRYAQGLGYDEVGARLGLTRSAVESRLHRARAQLRRALEDGDRGPT